MQSREAATPDLADRSRKRFGQNSRSGRFAHVRDKRGEAAEIIEHVGRGTPKAEIAKLLGISRATLYRRLATLKDHLPPAEATSAEEVEAKLGETLTALELIRQRGFALALTTHGPGTQSTALSEYQKLSASLEGVRIAERAQAAEIRMLTAAGFYEPIRAECERRAHIARCPPDVRQMQARIEELEAENRQLRAEASTGSRGEPLSDPPHDAAGIRTVARSWQPEVLTTCCRATPAQRGHAVSHEAQDETGETQK